MGKKLLIIEDDSDNSTIMTKILNYYGYETFVAANSNEALSFCNKNPPPSLILMDISLPEMSGIELAPLIKKINNYKDIPIIAVTAHSSGEMEKKVIDAGCVNMLCKPFTPSELVKTVEQYVKNNS